MAIFRTCAFAVAIASIAAACGVDPSVTATRADRIAPAVEPPGADAPVFEDPAGSPGAVAESPSDEPPAADETPTSSAGAPEPATSDPSTTDPAVTDPVTTDPPETAAASTPPIDPAAIDFGIGKPPQPYDDYLLAAVSDIEAWWAEQLPAVWGQTFQPLEGHIIAAYPERPDDVPGCGSPRTSYQDVREFAAFYCGIGDFMVYDDADGGLLANLADRFGPATIAIVLAHEYGHAIQLRIGALDRNLATITTEQQADCFAGAWAARARHDASSAVRFSDDDVRAGLISMLEVRDPVGLNQFAAGGHGSGFDRVGAFQVGFLQGVGRCSTLLDEPLPLSPADFLSPEDAAGAGNAIWGYADTELFDILPNDLNLFWTSDVAATAAAFDPLVLVPVQSQAEVDCPRLGLYFEQGAALCLESDSVYVNEPAAFELYRQDLFGDFSIGYLLGVAWADAAQRTLGSSLSGEARALLSDCMAGAWVKTDILVDYEFPQPRHPERTTRISPGDLDETIRTIILIGDATAEQNVVGTPFEKIAAFRDGLIGGIDTCLAQL